MKRSAVALASLSTLLLAAPAEAQSFASGSLIVPMDVDYQDDGMLEAYGLVYELLSNGITVHWVIDENKTAFYLGGAVDPSMTDMTATFEDVQNAATTGTHDYRGGPFVIDAADAAAAMAIITPWQASTNAETNDASQVVVHRATGAFDAPVDRTLVAAPTIAMMADGNQDIARGYMQAAWIPDSTGDLAWPDQPNCGNPRDPAGSPDMLRPCDVGGPTTTDDQDGMLFDSEGDATYCQFMSMHWGIGDAQNEPEVVRELRSFLNQNTHVYAECQAVNAFENLVTERQICSLSKTVQCETAADCPPGETCDFLDCSTDGHATCEAINSAWRCSEDNEVCGDQTGFWLTSHGFKIGDQQNSHEFLNVDEPYAQIDGAFGSVGGSEAAYTIPGADGNAGDCTALSGTCSYKAGDVVMVTAGDGNPATDDTQVDDVWMTGFLDGACPPSSEFCGAGTGKVSYLGGHRYSTDTPISGSDDTQGTRLFLNSLFEAPCATTAGQPVVSLTKSGPAVAATDTITYAIDYGNTGPSTASAATIVDVLPPGTTFVSASNGGVEAPAGTVTWDVGNLGPQEVGSVNVTVMLGACGIYDNDAQIDYRIGVTAESRMSNTVMTNWCAGDGDGDGDGDGTTSGDGDGDGTSATGDGDGDGTSATGDGDGTSATGDGDGDGTSATGDGDGDGTSATGDGDGDGSAGDGDGSAGDGDGSAGDGDGSAGDGDGSAGDGDGSTGDGDSSTGDGDGATGDGDSSTGDGDSTSDGGSGDSQTGTDDGADDAGMSETDGTGDGGEPAPGGCNCSTSNDAGPLGTGVLALGLLGLRRRRRR